MVCGTSCQARNATTGSQLITYTGHSDYVWVAAWAPNGSSIATGSWDSTVQIWDPNTGSRILRYTATQPVRATPDPNRPRYRLRVDVHPNERALA